MKSEKWKTIIEKIKELDDFKKNIKQNGYYRSPRYSTFSKYLEKEWETVLTRNAAYFLSKDFWHKQPKTFNNEYYIIRTGKGSFAIFDKNIFPSPYLKFEIKDVIEIDTVEPSGYDYLKHAFKENILENSALEQLRFNGAYKKIIANVLGKENDYHVGIRGNTTRKFNVYFYRKDTNKRILIYEYNGQADVDYSLWTDDSVFLFEAKKMKRKNIENSIDIGWHKLAYACARFMTYENLNIYPIYFLRTINKVFLFVFPKFSYYNNGIILNEPDHLIPQKIFSIDMK